MQSPVNRKSKELFQRITADYFRIKKAQGSRRNGQLSDIVSKIIDLKKELMDGIEN